MPKRLFLYKGSRPSEGLMNLRTALGVLTGSEPTVLRPEGSTIVDNQNKVILNWGSSGEGAHVLNRRFSRGTFLNKPDRVAIAVNKAVALSTLRDHEIPHVTYFGLYSGARDFVVSSGTRVYARTKLTGHSGEGIVLMMREDDPQWSRIRQSENNLGYQVVVYDGRGGIQYQSANNLVSILSRCTLFTVGTVGRRSEYRIHVFNGKVILSQSKRRRSGFTEGNSLVRNVANGWVYAISEEELVPMYVKRLALEAIATLGLDFGAVDIVTSGPENCKVLEVNTAPGIEDNTTTATRYANAINEYLHQE